MKEGPQEMLQQTRWPRRAEYRLFPKKTYSVKHEIYSDRYMEIQGETVLKGYDFRSNEQMTNYSIHNSVGTFPINEEKQTPVPDPEKMEEYADTTQNVNKSNNKKS